MPQKRKLQVFVSSTYIDMIEERQAAVEAILQAGHIPAGMELFAGANEDQMIIIKRWIDDSDIFLLLLSGRYGSIDPKSKKSYTHLEFDYAKKKKKKIVVAVASESYLYKKESERKGKNSILEKDNLIKFNNFKNNATSKYARSWDNIDALRFLTINAIRALEDDSSLIGWIPGDQGTNSAEIANQLAILIKENKELMLLNQSKQDSNTLFNGLEYKEVNGLLSRATIDIKKVTQTQRLDFQNCSFRLNRFGTIPNLIHLICIWYLSNRGSIIQSKPGQYSYKLIERLGEVGLIENVPLPYRGKRFSENEFRISTQGRRYFLKMMSNIDESNILYIKSIFETDDKIFEIFID